MGKSDSDRMEFWTKEEYDTFISSLEVKIENYLIKTLVFQTAHIHDFSFELVTSMQANKLSVDNICIHDII